jgi:hypothetical protein
MNMRGSAKWQSYAAYQGYHANIQVFDDEEDDPMAIGNNTVKRAFIKQEVLCAVLQNGESVHFESRLGFNGADYAKQAHKKFGPCRVIFYQANEAQMWREIRWKNVNVGALYKRPSFITLGPDKVPENLRLAAMLL